MERFRSKGNGGQNVNKVETAIRLTHIPTGITATSQDQRSQSQNYKMALQTLEERLAEAKRQLSKEVDMEFRANLNKGRVRTYDFTRNIAFDHIRNRQMSLKKVLDGELDLVL